MAVPLIPLIGAVLAAIVGSLFAGADTAVTSLSSARLGALIEQATGPSKRAYERIRASDARLRSRYLLGRILCNALTPVFLLEALDPAFRSWGPVIALLGTVVLTGLMYEVSCTLARKHADRAALLAARYLRVLEVTMLPLAIPLSWIASWLGRRELDEPMADPRVTEAEVEIMVEEVEKSGLFGHEPAEMIRNVLEFADLTAADVMIPRSKVEAIELGTSLQQAFQIITGSGHSRYPVYKEQIDNIVGLLYAKDLFKVLEAGGIKQTSLRDVIRSPANFVAESQPLSSLLREMRSRRQHLAIVVDEFGGVSGIVTLEDVLEEIVGDIRDEHDVEEPIVDLGNGRLVADGDVSIRDLSDYLGAELPKESNNESLGSMLMHHFGKVPEAGTALSKFGLQFIVRDASEGQIGKVEIVRPSSAA